MTMKYSAILAVALSGLMTSCAGGYARILPVKGDLCELDRGYLEACAKPTHSSASDELERRYSCLPICLAPLVTSSTDNSAIYSPALDTEPESGAPSFKLVGFEHRRRQTIGFGLALYNTTYGSWKTDGRAQRWSSRFGLAGGLLYSHYHSRDTSGATQRGTKFLKGLIGYTHTSRDSHLHLFWIPIRVQ